MMNLSRKQRHYLGLLMSTFFLTACGMIPKSRVEVIASSYRDELPPTLFQKPGLLPEEFDAPRDTTTLVLDPEADSHCAGLPATPSDDSHSDCYIHPTVDSKKTNIHRGYDFQNWSNHLINQKRQSAYIDQLEQAWKQENDRRTKAIEANKAERARVDAELKDKKK